MPSKQPRQPYQDTEVNWLKSQGEIGALLEKYGIKDFQFSSISTQRVLVLQFVHPTKGKDGVTVQVPVRITIPNVRGDNRNQMFRLLFYWLKSKFEALNFGLVEFEEEFFAHLVVPDGYGNTTTIYRRLAPQYMEGLASGRVPELNLMPDRMLPAGEGRR